MSIDTEKEFLCYECDLTIRTTLRECPYFCPGCEAQGTVYPKDHLHMVGYDDEYNGEDGEMKQEKLDEDIKRESGAAIKQAVEQLKKAQMR